MSLSRIAQNILKVLYGAYYVSGFDGMNLSEISRNVVESTVFVRKYLLELTKIGYIERIGNSNRIIRYAITSKGILYMQSTLLENSTIVNDSQSHTKMSIFDELMEPKNNRTEGKSPMVFISHSSGDKKFVESLVDLLDHIGLSDDNVFCSSVPGYNIRLRDNICDTLRSLFLDYELYVLFIHSPRFYESSISLNEMGAAWVLKTKYYSILTKDMTYDAMNGVVTKDNIAIKIDSEDAQSRLNELKDDLISVFKLKPLSENKWERQRDKFLREVNNLQYDKKKVNEINSADNIDVEFKRLQVERLKREEKEQKKANIRSEILKNGNHYRLNIKNIGKSTARKIRVQWLNVHDSLVFVDDDFSYIDSLSSNSRNTYPFYLAIGHPQTMNLRISWEDDYSDSNVVIQYLQL